MGTVKLKVFLLMVLILSISSAAHAGRTAPLINYENVAIVGQPDKILSLEDVSHAVAVAAVAKNWTLSDVSPGQATATLVVRNKHTMIVKITYTEKTLSIKYMDSINMNYDPAHKEYAPTTSNLNALGQPVSDSAPAKVQEVIHPNYNVWVGQLLKAIQVELTRMR